jgi:hypothetical protein
MTFISFLKRACRSAKRRFNTFKERCIYNLYTKVYTPNKVRQIRRKEQISIVFVITEVGVWKTEQLYLEMLNHHRFNPILLALPSKENDKAFDEVVAFLQNKQYDYVTLKGNETIHGKLKPDIIFYQKPYWGGIDNKYYYKNNLSSLFCYANYAFHSVMEDWAINQDFLNYAWLVFYENESCAGEAKSIMSNGGRNIIITGLPMADELITASEKTEKLNKDKKTIIWAPHHTIPQKGNWLDYSTFLEYADHMIEIADKHKEKVNFIFKPHPLLQPKLRKLWGETKTLEYYKKWETMPNTRVELGKYLDLFAESDAMIHDCGSFTIEYLYFNKSVLYLKNGKDHETNMAQYAKEAYHVHYFGTSKQSIDTFIMNVIANNDPMDKARREYINKHLQTPNHQTACKNIIDAILGHSC